MFAATIGLMLIEWARAVPIPPAAPDILTQARGMAIEIVLHKNLQILLVCALFMNQIWFLWARGFAGSAYSRRKPDAIDVCAFIMALLSVSYYLRDWGASPASGNQPLLYFGIEQCTNVPVFMGGMLVFYAFRLIAPSQAGFQLRFALEIAYGLIAFLACASLLHNGAADHFQYRGVDRALGPWVNPNTFGVLMGIGLIVALALLIRCFTTLRPAHDAKARLFSAYLAAFFVGAMLVFINGLMRSLSRGAFLATAAGTAYLLWNARGKCPSPMKNCLQARLPSSTTSAASLLLFLKRGKWLVISVCFLCVILVCQLNDSENNVLRRLLSAGNANDFSWRNRILAVKGALQILADHSLIGSGWPGATSQFEHYYMPARLADHWSIILNDFLTLGIALGIPGLALFIGLISNSWNAFNSSRQRSQFPMKDEVVQISFRAALISFLVAFFLDGGLFKLALGVPFWMLLGCAAKWRDAE